MRDPLRDPLGDPTWRYVEGGSLDELTVADWAILAPQRDGFLAGHQADAVLGMFAAGAGGPSYGYQLNNYRHGLATATLARADGCDEETVAVALLHDLALTACPSAHGAVSAALLGPYISDANRWMLSHHQIFQDFHCDGYDRDGRERWRGHPHFEWTARFVARYDQTAIRADMDILPVDAFVPLVRRLFARPPQPLPPE